MKKKLISICGFIIAIILIIAGFYTKSQTPRQYYMRNQENYIEVISQIHQINDKSLINICKTIIREKYIAMIYEYNNEMYLQVFKQKSNYYYVQDYYKTMSLDDHHIYYKAINDNNHHIIIVFGYNPTDEELDVILSGTYLTSTLTTIDNQSSNLPYFLCILEGYGDNFDKVHIYNQDHSIDLGEAKRCG